MRTRADLVACICGNLVCQMAQQRVQHFWGIERHRLDALVQRAALALYDVGGQRPGAPHKT